MELSLRMILFTEIDKRDNQRSVENKLLGKVVTRENHGQFSSKHFLQEYFLTFQIFSEKFQYIKIEQRKDHRAIQKPDLYR